MAKTDFKSVDEYLATLPTEVQVVLQRVRSVIRKALPAAAEVISYQIPAYKLQGTAVLYFAGWKQHYSLYPATDRVVSEFKTELAPYKVNKGTIRFPLSEAVPAKLIASIAKCRAQEAVARIDAKSASGKAKAASTKARVTRAKAKPAPRKNSGPEGTGC
jgi:uncharacterized protein YdhG (YjbR/CyaY superfamily)